MNIDFNDIYINLKWITWIIPAVFISGVGWLANYLYKVSKWEQFKLFKLLVNILLAAWLWYIVQWFIDETSSFYWPTLSITWFCAYPILQWLENNWVNFIVKILSKWH